MIIRLRPDPHLPGLGVLLEGGAEQGVYVGGVAASAQPGLVPGHQETPDTGDWDTEQYNLLNLHWSRYFHLFAVAFNLPMNDPQEDFCN